MPSVYPASLKGRFIMYRWTYSDSAEMYHSAYQNVRQGERRITTLAECKRSILAAAAKSDSVRYARITEYSDENPMGDTIASYNVKRKSDGTYHLSVCKKVDMGKANYLRSISGIRGAF